MTQNRAYPIAQTGSKWLSTGTIIDDADCIQMTEKTGANRWCGWHQNVIEQDPFDALCVHNAYKHSKTFDL